MEKLKYCTTVKNSSNHWGFIFLCVSPATSKIHPKNNFSTLASGISKHTNKMAAKIRDVTRLSSITKTLNEKKCA